MIKLIDSGAEIVTTEYRDLDFGTVVKQDLDSITVQFMNLNSFGKVYHEYAFPDAFKQGLIYIRGEANEILLESFDLFEQYNAIKTSINTLSLDRSDPAFISLTSKQEEILEELSTIQERFENAVKAKDIDQHWEYVDRDEAVLEDDVILLASKVECAKKFKEDFEKYSGAKFKKEYKNLKARYDSAVSSAETSISSINRTEDRLKGIYKYLGIDYQPKYSSLNANTYDSLIESFSPFEDSFVKLSLRNMSYVLPWGFRIIHKEPEYVVCENDDGYIVEVYIGNNENLSAVERHSTYKITTIERYGGGSTIRYVSGTNDINSFYFQEEIFPEARYSLDVTKKLVDESDVKEVEGRIFRIERLFSYGQSHF